MRNNYSCEFLQTILMGFGVEKKGQSQTLQRKETMFLRRYPVVRISWPQTLKSRKGDPAFSVVLCDSVHPFSVIF